MSAILQCAQVKTRDVLESALSSSNGMSESRLKSIENDRFFCHYRAASGTVLPHLQRSAGLSSRLIYSCHTITLLRAWKPQIPWHLSQTPSLHVCKPIHTERKRLYIFQPHHRSPMYYIPQPSRKSRGCEYAPNDASGVLHRGPGCNAREYFINIKMPVEWEDRLAMVFLWGESVTSL